MIQPRGVAFVSLTSIQPDSRVMTMGAPSEVLRLVLAFRFPLFIDVVVEFVIAVCLSSV